MSDSAFPAIHFGRIAAALPVSDIERARAFYVDVLGFTVTFANGTPTGFMILRRDEAELHLTLVKDLPKRPYNAAHLMVGDVDRLHERCQTYGVRIIKGLRDKDFGLRAFVFEDPEGNRIDVGQPL